MRAAHLLEDLLARRRCASATACSRPRSSRRSNKVREPFNVNTRRPGRRVLLARLTRRRSGAGVARTRSRRPAVLVLRPARHQLRALGDELRLDEDGQAGRSVRGAAGRGGHRPRFRDRSGAAGRCGHPRGHAVATIAAFEAVVDEARLALGVPLGARRRDTSATTANPTTSEEPAMLVVMRDHASQERSTTSSSSFARPAPRRTCRKARSRRSSASSASARSSTRSTSKGFPGVEEVIRVLKPYKLVSREFQPEDTVVTSGDPRVGGGAFAVMAGPCSIESEEQMMSVAAGACGGGSDDASWRGVQAAHEPVRVPGHGPRRPEASARGGDSVGLPVVTEVLDVRDARDGCRMGRRPAGRRAQHGRTS